MSSSFHSSQRPHVLMSELAIGPPAVEGGNVKPTEVVYFDCLLQSCRLLKSSKIFI